MRTYIRTLFVNALTKRLMQVTVAYGLTFLIPASIEARVRMIVIVSAIIFLIGGIYYGRLIWKYTNAKKHTPVALLGLFYNSMIAVLSMALVLVAPYTENSAPVGMRALMALTLVFYYSWIYLIVAYEGSRE